MRTIVIIVALLPAAAGLGGCAEEPQRLAAAEAPGFRTDSWDEQLRERTLHQGEARRIYH
jgi:hypothetical protein